MWDVLIAVRRVAARSEIHVTRVKITRLNVAKISAPADSLPSMLSDASMDLETLLTLAAALDNTQSVSILMVT